MTANADSLLQPHQAKYDADRQVLTQDKQFLTWLNFTGHKLITGDRVSFER